MKRIFGFAVGVLIVTGIWFVSRDTGIDTAQKISRQVKQISKPVSQVIKKQQQKVMQQKVVKKDNIVKPSEKEKIIKDKPGQMPEKQTPVIAPGKYFFWKPFNLKSRADGFAKYIYEKTSVLCEVEKKGTGIYRVYFYYFDNIDKSNKKKIIEQTGIKLNFNNGGGNENGKN